MASTGAPLGVPPEARPRKRFEGMDWSRMAEKQVQKWLEHVLLGVEQGAARLVAAKPLEFPTIGFTFEKARMGVAKR